MASIDRDRAQRAGNVAVQGDALARVAGVVALGDMMTRTGATDTQIQRALTLYEVDPTDENVAAVRAYLNTQ